MKILAIETSCDETAIAILQIDKKGGKTTVSILGDNLYSQVKIHEKYGGVFPMMAKREHAKSLTPILEKTLMDSKLLKNSTKNKISKENIEKIEKILKREEGLSEKLIELLEKIEKPKINYVAVTNGPGLEPALWVGINFAKALSLAWNIPIIPVNHMEGHLLSSFLQKEKNDYSILNIKFPLLALLISGGHTELVLMKSIGKYKIIGQTKDDAVGEAFDKVARMLELPYPGGPEISRLAENARKEKIFLTAIKLPRPMINSKDFDFSYAGLKTAVLYTLKKITKIGAKINESIKKEIALEFENAATETLVAKSKKALEETSAKTFTIGGGVSANVHIREEFTKLLAKEFPKVNFLIPNKSLTTDNAVMIGLAAFYKTKKKFDTKKIQAEGNLRLV